MPAIVGFLGHLGPRNTQMCLATVPTNTWLCHVHRYIEEERMHWVYWSANFSRHQHQTTRANTQIKVPGPQFVQPWNEGIVHTEQSSAVLPVFSFYVTESTSLQNIFLLSLAMSLKSGHGKYMSLGPVHVSPDVHSRGFSRLRDSIQLCSFIMHRDTQLQEAPWLRSSL